MDNSYKLGKIIKQENDRDDSVYSVPVEFGQSEINSLHSEIIVSFEVLRYKFNNVDIVFDDETILDLVNDRIIKVVSEDGIKNINPSKVKIIIDKENFEYYKKYFLKYV